MARRKKPEPVIQSGMITVKIDRELNRQAGAIAEWRGIDKQDYIEEVLRAAVEADYVEFLQRETQRHTKPTD